MKLRVIIFLLGIVLLTPATHVKAATVSSNLKGKILLQVESHGEAWYVNPKDGKRYYMANGDEAFQIMKTLGVGINNKDWNKVTTDASYRKKFIGKIFLQVESHGEAYYIGFDGQYYYLKDGVSAFNVMKKLGLGISSANLNKIAPGSLATSSAMMLFTDERCPHCKNVEDYITQNKIKNKFNFQELQINNNPGNAKLFTQKVKQCNLISSGVPLFFDGKNCIIGDTDIIAFLKP